MVAAAVGVEDEAMLRGKRLKSERKGASLVLESVITDMMEWGPFVYENE